MSTPPCRCGHPSHYHGGGPRPWTCNAKGCDCSDFWPHKEDISRAIADAVQATLERLVPEKHRGEHS